MTDEQYTALEGHNDPSGNAPMIPRKVLIDVLNELQLLQTRILIALNQHAPDHFKETASRPDKVTQPVWSSTGTGQPEQSVVSTLT